MTPREDTETRASGYNPYPGMTLLAIPRAFMLQDFNPHSKTYGCCDRIFWNYKTVTDYPAASMQQLALAFAVLYSVPFDGNIYYRNPDLLERARAAMLHWTKAMHRNGAVDEWYRNEFSYCATAFTALGIAESLLILEKQLDSCDAEVLRGALLRAARWLDGHFNPFVMNQNLAACGALWDTFACTGEDWLRLAFRRKWARTLEHFNTEGWFSEYGGADLGYSTLALDLIALLDRAKCPVDTVGLAQKLCDFIASFVCRTGDLAGGLGSRGTSHTFPFGAEAFAGRIPAAALVAHHLREEYRRGSLTSPAAVDDRYLAYFYLPQFALACAAGPIPSVPSGSGSDQYWSSSGFVILRREPADLVCSLNRNGAFNLYASGLPVHRNWGYWVETQDGQRWTSAGWVPRPAARDLAQTGRILVEGPLVRVDDSLPLVRWGTAFHFLCRWILCWDRLGEFFQYLVRKRKIARSTQVPLRIERTIAWEEEALVVIDRVVKTQRGPALRRLGPAADVGIHSPSARTSSEQQPDCVSASDSSTRSWVERLNQHGMIRLRTIYSKDSLGRLKFRSISEAVTPPSLSATGCRERSPLPKSE